jgi:hypothetical protein
MSIALITLLYEADLTAEVEMGFSFKIEERGWGQSLAYKWLSP